MAWGRLALLQAADDQQVRDKLAALFGYTRLPDDTSEQSISAVEGQDQMLATTDGSGSAPQRLPARFLRINKIVKTEPDPNDLLKPDYLSDPKMRLCASEGTYRFASPVSFMSKSQLLPLLFNSLAQARTGHGLNHRLLIQRIAQGQALHRLPKRQQQRWPQRLHIIVDVSSRLEPYWSDFELIVRQLQTLLGKEAVQALRFDEDTLGAEASFCLPWPDLDHHHWQRWQAPPANVAILILGDIGVGDQRAAIAWQRQLRCLQQHSSPILCLSPASFSPNNRSFCQQFKPNPINDYYPLPRHPLANGFTFSAASKQCIEDILTWLAPLPLIDSGLLRRLRVAMQWGDSALEALIWNHSALRNIGLGVCLQQQVVQRYQHDFQQRFAGTGAASRFWHIVEHHHAAAYQGLRQLEQFKHSVFEQRDQPAMRDYFQRLCATGMQSGSDPAQQRALRMQCQTVLTSLPDSIWNSALQELAYSLYAVVHEDDICAGHWPETLPAGFNPEHLHWLPGDASADHDKQAWQIVQLGDQGQIQCAPCSLDNGQGVKVFKTEISRAVPPRLSVSDSTRQITRMLQNNDTATLADNTTAEFVARGLKLELEAIHRPDWASRICRDAEGLTCSIPWLGQHLDVSWQISNSEANGSWRWPAPFGEDNYGRYLDLNVNAITQRFRWIQPGTFWMGSPKDEPEREWGGVEGGEGSETLHQVTLTQGFWLADSAVSQAFWQVVMADNPSHFTDNPDNPVERISWQDAQNFIDKLNSLLPGLQAQLPSEAQWEYACRAGTTTPFSFGANMTTEQVNYNGTYPYADGQHGLYREHTMPVKSLPANPWGLYEMHGNVWEWCADVWQQQLLSEPVTDPLIAEVDGVTARVVRGGSWDDDGWSVRSAIRFRDTPDDRLNDLGFRLALGHVELRPGQDIGKLE